MEINRKKMIDFLEEAQNCPFYHLRHAMHCPDLQAGNRLVQWLPGARLILPLTGDKNIIYFDGKHSVCNTFHPGEALLCHTSSPSCEVWDLPHRMVSVVFMESCIRVIFIEHDGISPTPKPEFYYHTPTPLDAQGIHLLHALQMSEFSSPALVDMLFRALLRLVYDALLNALEATPSTREDFLLNSAKIYIENNFQHDVTSHGIASALKIHPAHLARIFKHKLSCGVSHYLTEFRMNQAVRLLEETSLTVNEIADHCGYSCATYFIRVFRRHFSCSPGAYRLNQVDARPQENRSNRLINKN